MTQDVAARIQERVEFYRDDIVQFLRDIVAIPSMESQIGDVGERIAQEMKKLGFDDVFFDSMGNVAGCIGSGAKILLYDSHIDTVSIADPTAWKWDPWQGKIEDGILYGLGACDEKCSTPGMVYGLAIAKELGLLGDFTLYYFGNMEEHCDGISGHSLVETEKIVPDYVVIGEPTNMAIYRGHRGRVELKLQTKGRTCHASAPERGENAIYKMARVLLGIEKLNDELTSDSFLGKGSIVASIIESKAPSLNAVPDECTVYVDRRMTLGETKELAIEQIKALPGADQLTIEVMEYDIPSYTGFRFPVEKYFPAWAVEEEHPLVQAGVTCGEAAYGEAPRVGTWVFSTNGIYWAGKAGIPCIGFAPSNEIWAHSNLDQVPIEQVVESTKWYAQFPSVLREKL